MKSELGLGLIGLGRIGKKHIEMLGGLKQARLVAVCDLDRHVTDAAAQTYQVKPCYDWRKLVDIPAVDAILVLTPPESHPEMTIEAAAKGKHVFCEKPIAPTVAEAMKMAEAVSSSGVKFQLGFNERYDVAKVEAKKFIQGGGIGRPIMTIGKRHVTSEVPGPIDRWLWDDTRGGGPLIECILHEIDLSNWYLDSRPVRVYAEAHDTAIPGIRCADNAAMIVKYENGGIASLASSWTLPEDAPFEAELEVIGTEGVVYLRGPQPAWSGFTIMSEKGVAGQYPISAKGFDDKPDFTKAVTTPVSVELLRNSPQVGSRFLQHADFVECIMTGRAPRVGIKEGIEALRIAIAAVESSRKNIPVDLTERSLG